MSPRSGRGRPPLRFLRAFKAAVESEDWVAAAAQAETAIAAKPNCAEARFAHALVSIYRDELAMALDAATRACELAPGIGDYEDLLAVIYGSRRRSEQRPVPRKGRGQRAAAGPPRRNRTRSLSNSCPGLSADQRTTAASPRPRRIAQSAVGRSRAVAPPAPRLRSGKQRGSDRSRASACSPRTRRWRRAKRCAPPATVCLTTPP